MPGTPDPYASFRLNLEQQRKRAKDLLRAARAGDREAMSRLHAATGGRLTADNAKLTDAQFVVARELGLPSWRELRRHIDALTAARAAIEHTPAPDGGVPTLHVRCGSDIQQELVRAIHVESGATPDGRLSMFPTMRRPSGPNRPPTRIRRESVRMRVSITAMRCP